VPTQASQPGAEQLLFLRGGDLYALDLASRRAQLIVENVSDFVVTRDAAQLALVRGSGLQSELWMARRDGSALTQLTQNTRAEASPAWAPDGSALVYASSTASEPYAHDWLVWSSWCAASEIRVLEIASRGETSLAPGCDPAISPDGRRIAFAAPPARIAAGYGEAGPREANAIRLINRQGQNGWNFARAEGGSAPSGLVVYAPSWTPDGAGVLYQRFVGMQVEVSVNLTELGRSFEGKGRALDEGAGWLLAARPAPDGTIVSITEHNYDNARGLTGYGSWGVSLIKLQGQRDVAMPSGTVTMIGQQVGQLPAGQRTAWAPDGRALAVQLPERWQAGADPEPWVEGQGTIWRWVPGADPDEQLIDDVDFASPIAWLPAR
jgi:hypothetical protein